MWIIFWLVGAVICGALGGTLVEAWIWRTRYREYHRAAAMRHDPEWSRHYAEALSELDRVAPAARLTGPSIEADAPRES